MSEPDRVDRERAFHDARFGHDSHRERTAKYYTADTGKRAYRRTIDALAPGADLLEYGCGPGALAVHAAKLNARVTGIDISAVAVERARAAASDAGVDGRFLVNDAHRLDLSDNSFDVVCGSGILHHLDLVQALSEVARVLRPDGTAVFYEPLGMNPLIRLYRRFTPSMRTADEHPLVAGDFALAERYFGVVDAESHTLLALISPVLRRVGPAARALPLLQRADRWLFQRVPITRRLAWIVVIRLSQPIR